jgi:hypothetical protein
MTRSILAIALLSLACAREGYRLEAESTTQAPISTADVERMCTEAFVELRGARPGMTKQQIHAVVARQYGRAAADAIETSFGTRILAHSDALFLYTSALCDLKDLPVRCRRACTDAKDIGKAK